MAQRKKEASSTSSGDVQDGELPDRGCFRLEFPYGYIDDEGVHRFWRSGQVVSDPGEIALLQARGVNLKED